MLSEKKTEIEEKLKKDINDTNDMAITHDSWTSINTESYGTVTAHFIDKEWQLKSVVLETKKIEGSHTGEAIAENLRKTQTEWSLPNIVATTDNAANEIKAFEYLKWKRFGCFGHRINLMVKKALSIPELSKMLTKGRKLVTFFHQSSSAMDVLKEKQLLLFDTTTTHKLIQDVPTRWNSTLDMLQRLLDQTPAIISMVNDTKCTKASSEAIKNFSFNFQEQSVIQKIITVLEPFKKATTILCADINPTMQKVIPVIMKLDKSIQGNEDDPAVIQKMKQILQTEMEKRTQDRDIPLLACLLNPGTKNLEFLGEQDFQLAKSLMEQEAAKVVMQPITVKKEKPDEHLDTLPALPTFPTEENNNKPVSSKVIQPDIEEVPGSSTMEPKEIKGTKRKLRDMEDWLDDVIFVKEVTNRENKEPETQSKKEVENYLNCQLSFENESETILEWWRRNELYFPRLARVAKKLLAIPASSVSSERVFSLAGNIVNKKRSRLSATNVDTFIFMNKNMSMYW
jgi:hypothetical protein